MCSGEYPSILSRCIFDKWLRRSGFLSCVKCGSAVERLNTVGCCCFSKKGVLDGSLAAYLLCLPMASRLMAHLTFFVFFLCEGRKKLQTFFCLKFVPVMQRWKRGSCPLGVPASLGKLHVCAEVCPRSEASLWIRCVEHAKIQGTRLRNTRKEGVLYEFKKLLGFALLIPRGALKSVEPHRFCGEKTLSSRSFKLFLVWNLCGMANISGAQDHRLILPIFDLSTIQY